MTEEIPKTSTMNPFIENASIAVGPPYWRSFATCLLPQLESNDDANLWQVAIDRIFTDSSQMVSEYRGKGSILAEIGRCSHWIRPHWTKNGTRVTHGYDKTVEKFSLGALPAYDWSYRWLYETNNRDWKSVTGQSSRRPLIHRIAIPSRTTRHNQATVHSVWTPGSPASPNEKLTVVYGFEKADGAWKCFTSWNWKHSS
jgi:hypothetical protein